MAVRDLRPTGLRRGALVETMVLLALALGVHALWGPEIAAYVQWTAVLVAASYYGTREALVAALLASAVVLLPGLPEQRAGEAFQAWLFRLLHLPLLWCMAALVFGALRDGQARRAADLRAELAEMRRQHAAISAAYERLHEHEQHLETRVAGQARTVDLMYAAWRAIERHSVGEVLLGVGELVRAVLDPMKFSLYLRNGMRLEAASNGGWQHDDGYAREFEAYAPLYAAVVGQRRFLVVADADDAVLLGAEGVLAGPVLNPRSGEVVGMLKIEAIAFHDLNPSSVRHFRMLCDWIAHALDNAQRDESLRAGSAAQAPDGLATHAEFERRRRLLEALGVRLGFAVSEFRLTLALVDAHDAAEPARRVGRAARHALGEAGLCVAEADDPAAFRLLVAASGACASEAVAQSFGARLAREFAAAGLHGTFRLRSMAVEEAPA